MGRRGRRWLTEPRLEDRGGTDRQPIIFLTGNADIAMIVRAMKRGALEFLTKPFDAKALLIVMQHAIKRSEAAQTNCTRCERIMGRLLNANAK